MATDIITRAEAKAQGLKRYFTGTPCKHGHFAERFVSDGACVPCTYAKNSRWAKRNPGKKREIYLRWIDANEDWRKEYNKKYHAEWYRRNHTKKNEQSARWLREHPEANRAAALRWRNKNLEKARDAASKWYAENPEKRRALAKQKRERKPEVYAAHYHNRRARQQAGGTHTAADLAEILAAQENRCAYCRADFRKVKKHLDHIHPLSRGGSNARANLQWLCRPCNLQKGAKDPLQFAKEAGRLF